MRKNIVLLLSLLVSLSIFSQVPKLDKIIKTDNEILEVKISKVSDEVVEYLFPNETLKNIIKIAQIKTIVYSSGRIQNFSRENTIEKQKVEIKEIVEVEQKTTPPAQSITNKIEPNTIAVIPIHFYDKNNGVFTEPNATLAQQQIIKFLIEKSGNIMPLRILDARRTNSLLKKANITFADLENTPIEDLHQILGVQFIVTGKAAYTVQRTSTSTSTKTKTIFTDEDMVMSSNQQDERYDYEIALDVYRDNVNIYSQTRVPFFKFKDSWQDAFEYLLKRAPFYHD